MEEYKNAVGLGLSMVSSLTGYWLGTRFVNWLKSPEMTDTILRTSSQAYIDHLQKVYERDHSM